MEVGSKKTQKTTKIAQGQKVEKKKCLCKAKSLKNIFMQGRKKSIYHVGDRKTNLCKTTILLTPLPHHFSNGRPPIKMKKKKIGNKYNKQFHVCMNKSDTHANKLIFERKNKRKNIKCPW